MPLYEYRCTQCGYSFEKIQSFKAAPETECPRCHGKLERPLTAPALQFKGAGWYVNDYAGKAAANSPSAGSPDASSSGEAKPAAPDSTKPAAAESTAKPSAPAASSGS
ncbi:MAG TPA: FmdB family zinc ribbon protein [Terracidiphilus sp.]|nr:FmdB family zinc ribbon protein [Terracidiphilus sp.]